MTPNFVQVKGQFLNQDLKKETERKLLIEHLHQHQRELKEIIRDYAYNTQILNDKAGTLISKLIQTRLIDATRTVIMNSITTKNDKLYINTSITREGTTTIIHGS